MKEQINEVKRLQKIAGILKEAEETDDFEFPKVTELPKIDLEKLSRVLDMLVNYKALKSKDKMVLIDIIKNIPKSLNNTKKLDKLLKLTPSINFDLLSKKYQLVFKPLESAMYDIMFADESFHPKSTLLRAYDEINNFLKKMK